MKRTALALLALTACATPYQPRGVRGGYRERLVQPGLWQVEVAGNGYTSAWTLEGYFQQRARELCAAEGAEVAGFEYGDTPTHTAGDVTARAQGDAVRFSQGPGVTKHRVSGFVRCAPAARAAMPAR